MDKQPQSATIARTCNDRRSYSIPRCHRPASPSRVIRRDYPTIVRGCAFRISWERSREKTERKRKRERERGNDKRRRAKDADRRRYRWLEMPFVFRFPEFWWWNRGVARGDGWWRRKQCGLHCWPYSLLLCLDAIHRKRFSAVVMPWESMIRIPRIPLFDVVGNHGRDYRFRCDPARDAHGFRGKWEAAAAPRQSCPFVFASFRSRPYSLAITEEDLEITNFFHNFL